MPQEGYLLLAVERQKYFDMACNLARSIRLFDPHRPVALVVDDSISTAGADGLFDRIVFMKKRDGYVGVLHKLRLFELNPFDRALYVDSDCLMVKASIDAYWHQFAGGCNTLGEKLTDGSWKGLRIRDIVSAIGTDHLVKMNAGVIFLDRSEQARAMFDYMADILRDLGGQITTIHQGRAGQFSMEPILGAAMAKFGVEPMNVVPRAGSLMVSTWHARRIMFNLQRGVSYLEKPKDGSHFPGLRQWVGHSPILAHFIGLTPRNVYDDLVAGLRAP